VAIALDGLTDAQRDAVIHRSPPLLVSGRPGTGKTEVLVQRAAWLVEDGVPAAGIALLAGDAAAVEPLCARVERAFHHGHEAVPVVTVSTLCDALVAEHAAAAGIEEIGPVATAAERVAMLLERTGELELRHHDFRGRPIVLFAALVRRIDRLKSLLIDADRFAAWAARHGEREREFAALFAAHDRILAERGLLDEGGLLLASVRLLTHDDEVRRRTGERLAELLVDDWQNRSFGVRELIDRIEACGVALTVATDDDQALWPGGGASGTALFLDRRPATTLVTLEHGFRCPPGVAAAAQAMRGTVHEPEPAPESVRFWHAASERAQAQRIALEIETLIAAGTAPEQCAVLVRSLAGDGAAVTAALSERSLPHLVLGAGAFFQRTEIRDVLAWLRLLVDPRDAPAAVRALARPPIELHSVDIARCVQIARRRKLDIASALVAALESPQLSPEARERIAAFLAIHRDVVVALDVERPDLFVHRLIDRLGLRRQLLLSAQRDAAERLLNLAKLGELAARHSRAMPNAGPREFAGYLSVLAETGLGEEEAHLPAAPGAITVAQFNAVAGCEFDCVFVLAPAPVRPGGTRRRILEPIPEALLGEAAGVAQGSNAPLELPDAPLRALYVACTRTRVSLVLSYADSGGEQPSEPPPPLEAARLAVAGAWETVDEKLFGTADALPALYRERRDELIEGVRRVADRLGELRFDTDLDVAHSVVRFLELVKLAALLERREDEQSLADALADLNARLAAAASPLQREILLSSPLDDLLLGGLVGGAANAGAGREEPSLKPFLARRGDGLTLSASDIETYRTCPLRYKFARVFRIPQEPTLNQRFGIVVHQVLERFHEAGGGGIEELLRLLDVSWRRGGFGESDEERQLYGKARAALTRYRERFDAGHTTPRWFERSFSFALGAHQIRGRVDRVDELPAGGYELIDYKTGLPRSAAQLHDDVQLALYAVAAREAWGLEATERTYYYVLDDERVSLGADEHAAQWVTETVAQVGAGILAQRFAPTPSPAVCATCDFQISCPAAEK
jgi:DNA helicase-2/ATP-dependent DNA helicase PcrA